MSALVIIDGNKAFTTSMIIADGVNLDHRSVYRLLKKHSNTSTLSRFKIAKEETGGRSIEYAILDELQATFLITLMRNSQKVVQFKERLTLEFFRQRQIISNLIQQHHDPSWQSVRKDGKAVYHQKTDIIKQFVDYATEQGSKSASKYYMALAHMENKALFFFEQNFDNLREILTIKQLMQVSTADDVIERALIDGMEKGMPYCEIFQLAKKRVIDYANIIGRTPVLCLQHGEVTP